jgi:hypothetical protein
MIQTISDRFHKAKFCPVKYPQVKKFAEEYDVDCYVEVNGKKVPRQVRKILWECERKQRAYYFRQDVA